MTEQGTPETTEHRDTVAYAVLKTLNNYGIDTVFGIPGTHNLELYRAVTSLGVRAVTNRHEQGSGFGADGWSLQTGLPGVVITTSGPGLLNVLSAVATSYAESRPLIVLTPGPPRGEELADIGALHETKDTRAAAASVAEWARRVVEPGEAVQAVHDAFELFRTGRPRPVVIEIPLDVLEMDHGLSDQALEPKPAPEPQRADAESIRSAAQLLSSAERPVLIYGGGSLAAGTDLTGLAVLLDTPVVTTLNGRGAIPEHHPLSLGASLRLKVIHEVVNDADVLLIIGSKVGEAELWAGPLEPSGKVIRVDRLSSQIDKNLKADLGIVADASTFVPDLMSSLGNVPRQGRRLAEERVRTVREALKIEAKAWNPASVAASEAIAVALPPNVILGADSSQVCYYGTANFIPLEYPRSYLYMGTYATLGYGLPASIGARLADSTRPVVCVAGDGALMFSIQELVTAVEQDLDLVVIVVDNGGYKEIEENEASVDIAPIGVQLKQPDWAALADAFGGTGHRINDVAHLAPTLEQSMAAGGVHLIHLPLDLFNERIFA